MMTIVTTQLYGQQQAMTPNLQRLVDGNERFVNNEMTHYKAAQIRREELTTHQEPFAIIVGCSDSRVSPEIVFDQGIGDLFVVRTAGNAVGPISQDSIEFAVLYLHSKLILVVGHEGCGAVTAVLKGNTKDIENVAAVIEPAVKKYKGTDNLVDAIKANVLHTVEDLKATQQLAPLVKSGALEIRGGYYDFHSGKVTILD
jgi:carbonic anhydrase